MQEGLRGVTTVSFGKREKSERRRRRKCWVMNYRADHFRLTPEREWGERGGGRLFFCCCALSGTWEATGGSNLWPIEAAATTNIDGTAASGSIATDLAGRVNPAARCRLVSVQ